MLTYILSAALLVTSADAFAPSLAFPGATSRFARVSSERKAVQIRSGLRMGLEKIDLKNSEGHTCTVYPYGACVTSYKAPHEVLFVRPDAKLDGSKPISGGIPHCFPQFGPGEIQQHGFARNLNWRVAEKMLDEKEPSIKMTLENNDETMAMWPNKFQATYKVCLGAESLDTELIVKNTDTKPWTFTAALHTYLATGDIDKTKVTGPFKGSTYLDKMQKPPAEVKEARDAVVFDKEVDSVYKGVTGEIALEDGTIKTRVRNLKGWEDTVLWSPYGNEGMGYKKFACVESAKCAEPVTLAPGESWNAITCFFPK